MPAIITLTLGAVALALLLTPPWRYLCRRCGLMDRPDTIRHLHDSPVPRAGGVPVLAAYLGALALLAVSPLSPTSLIREALPVAGMILPGAAMVFFAGLADDIRGLKPWQKLAVQTIAGAAAYWAGIRIVSVAGFTVPHWLSLPITLIWLAGCSNAFNLIDGLDGLAAGIGLFATATLLLGALLHGNMTLVLVAAPLAGALAGFLPYNFNPASIFLGDSGSLTLGFLLGCYAVLWSQKGPAALGMAAPVMALGLPLLETAVTVLRRFLSGKPLFAADNGHVHYRLLARGLTPRRAAFLLYGVCGLAAVFSLLSSISRGQVKGAIVVLFCVAAWAGIQYVGYAELRMAAHMLLGGAFRHMLAGQLAVRRFQDGISRARNAGECFGAICEACREFGFQRAEMFFQGKLYDESFGPAEIGKYWDVTVPLSETEWVRLHRHAEAPALPVMIPFVDAVKEQLPLRLRRLSAESGDRPQARAVGR